MSPHTDAGALLKLADRLRNFAVWNARQSHYEPVPLCREAAEAIESIARQSASQGSAGGDVDPADIWDAYCEEVPAERRSHQGAMAFAIDQLFSTGAQTPGNPEVWRTPSTWKCPIETIGDLVNNLLTLDQEMKVFGAYHIHAETPDRCRARGLSLSREHVTNDRIKADDSIPYSLVIWTGADERASPVPSAHRVCQICARRAPDPCETIDAAKSCRFLPDAAPITRRSEADAYFKILQTIARFPITDPKNTDAVNMRLIAEGAIAIFSTHLGGDFISVAEVKLAMLQLAKQVKLDTIEACAKIVEPKGPRPCDCERCDCHNQGDAEAVATWDSDAANAKAIRALAIPSTSREAPL